MVRHVVRSVTAGSLLALVAAAPALGQDRGISYTLYGTPGLIDMPTAMSAPDGEITATLGLFSGHGRNTLTFQITPRLSGSFRYSGVRGYSLTGLNPPADEVYYDRSFDLRYRFLDEGEWLPAMAVGLQDFLGTGQFSAEYVVATKTIGDSLRVTAGLGWGRLGSYNGFTNPLGALDASFETRPPLDFGKGGTVATDQLFRGDAALFAGVEYAINDRFTIKAEYSSDAYTREAELGLLDVNSPFNLGLIYRPRPGVQVGLAYLYGSEFALTGTVMLNPNSRAAPVFDPAPVPVAVRAADARAAQSWDRAALPEATLRARLREGLAAEGITLNAVELGDRTARLRYTNTRYRTEAQAMGRAARIATGILPPSVEAITLEPMERGIPMSAATFQRTDLEVLENRVGGTDAALDRVALTDAGPRAGLVELPSAGNPFSWGLAPYLALTLFDGDNPVKADVGFELSARYEISPNLVLSGAIRKSLTPSDETRHVAESTLPLVRRNAWRYLRDGDPGLQHLTLAHYGRPGTDLYSRVTLGYLERMFGGISGELLWKPVDSRFALGAELNYVAQRDFDLGFGFQDYDVVTGHVSAYYDFENGFHAQVDAGRYLAGDWGATFALDREFENGWRVGGYFTLTDVPFDEFGEGSFDKGIRVTIPMDFFLGQPTQREANNTLSSLTRDGGARLQVDGRLYEVVRDGHLSDLEDGWGRFWR